MDKKFVRKIKGVTWMDRVSSDGERRWESRQSLTAFNIINWSGLVIYQDCQMKDQLGWFGIANMLIDKKSCFCKNTRGTYPQPHISKYGSLMCIHGSKKKLSIFECTKIGVNITVISCYINCCKFLPALQTSSNKCTK